MADAASTRGQNDGSSTTAAPASTCARSSRLTLPGETTMDASRLLIVPSTPGCATRLRPSAKSPLQTGRYTRSRDLTFFLFREYPAHREYPPRAHLPASHR